VFADQLEREAAGLPVVDARRLGPGVTDNPYWDAVRRVAFDEDDHAGVGAWVAEAALQANIYRSAAAEVEAELVADRTGEAAG